MIKNDNELGSREKTEDIHEPELYDKNVEVIESDENCFIEESDVDKQSVNIHDKDQSKTDLGRLEFSFGSGDTSLNFQVAPLRKRWQ